MVELADVTGNVAAYVYKADSYEGTIDGRGFGNFEVMSGSDNFKNQIYAGSTGSSLWGGNNGVNLNFMDGGSLVVNGQVGTFIVSGQSYQANYQTKTWSAK